MARVTSGRAGSEAPAWAAMLGAGAMIAHLVGGKATRSALFLSAFNVSSLPRVMGASALLTILASVAAAGAMRRLGPHRMVPLACLVSAALHLVENALLTQHYSKAAAVVLYLHVGMVPVLISGFWSTLSEGGDPRASRRLMERAALAASVGGVLGGAMAWSGAVPVMLGLLVVLDLLAGATVYLRQSGGGERAGWREDAPGRTSPLKVMFGRDVLRAAPYLGFLAVLVTLLAASATLLEYYLSAQVKAAYSTSPTPKDMMHFFSPFYTATALLALVVQFLLGRRAVKRIGLVPTAATLPASVVLGSAIALVPPAGLVTAAIARGSEMVARNSLFRSAYEPLYTAVPTAQKHATKTVVDAGFERVGDILGATAAGALLALGAEAAARWQLVFAMVLATGGLLLVVFIHRGYKEALRTNLEKGAVRLDPEELLDGSSVRIARDVLEKLRPPEPTPGAKHEGVNAQIRAIDTGDPVAIRRVLAGGFAITPPLVSHVIPLLGRDDVAGLAVDALRQVASEHTGQLLDRLLDRGIDLAVRRRIPRVLAVCRSTRAVHGLLEGLEDPRFEIRLQCGRALARMCNRDAGFRVDEKTVLSCVAREVEVEREVWKAYQLLEGPGDLADSTFVDEKLRQRADRGLEHVFNLLSLTLPRERLLLAFRALHTDDRFLRGTALEYLETVLARPIRDKLWPFLEVELRGTPEPRSPEAALATLLESHESIEISLAALQRRFAGQGGASPP